MEKNKEEQQKKFIEGMRKVLLIVSIITIVVPAALAIYETITRGTPILDALSAYGLFSFIAFLPLFIYIVTGRKEKQ